MKKIFKRILFTVIVLLFLVIISIPIYISYWRSSSTIDTFHTFIEPNDISFCNIKWSSEFLGEEKIDKIAFFVPVKIEGLKGNLFMQFDSGTQTTLFYGKTLNKVSDSHNPIETFYNEDSLRYFKNPVIQINDNQFQAEKIRIASSLGEEKIDSSFTVIGTIGYDAFVNRTLILDFKNDKLAITNTEIDNLGYDLSYLKDASIDKFPLIIPAKIGRMNTKLFYDTGSSMFSLITSNKRLKNINGNKIDSLCCISNWGKQLPVYKTKLDDDIKIGDYKYSNQTIYGCEVLDVVNYIPSWYLFGMTGNRLFNNTIVVIDTKNNKFGIEK